MQPSASATDTDVQYATNDGVDIAYTVAGPETAEPVVFIEGLSYGRWMWRWQRETLAEEYRTVVWDNRGTGDSDEPEGPYTAAEMAGDLEAVLDDVGVEAAHVVGASLGGMIAQRYALDYDRTASLTLLCTTPGGDAAVPIPDETLDRMLNVPREYGPREAIRHKMRPAFSGEFWNANEDLIEQIVDWRLEMDASERAYQWQSAATTEFDVADELGEIDVPTLVLHGTDDRVLPVENGRAVAERVPDAELVTVDGAPHLLFIEAAETVNREIRAFLERV